MDLILPVVIAIGIFSTVLTSSFKAPSHLQTNKVLGSEIAQSDTTQPDTTTTDNSTPESQPTDTPTDEASPTDAPTPETSPEDLITEETSTPEASPVEFTDPANTAAVINPDAVINSMQNVTQDTIDTVKSEEDTINNTSDPVTQTQLLLNVGNSTIQDLSDSIQQNNWSGVNFTTQRLNDSIDRISANIDKVNDSQNTSLKQQISDLCDVSDPALRVYALTVPQDLEQDIEIGRGKCLTLKQ